VHLPVQHSYRGVCVHVCVSTTSHTRELVEGTANTQALTVSVLGQEEIVKEVPIRPRNFPVITEGRY
jgi:hypothetical protein